MNKKIFSVLLVAVLTASYVQAQFSIGARAGLNITNVSVKNVSMLFGWEEHELLTPKYKYGFQIGAIGEYSISNNFAIQSCILFATQGYKAVQSDMVLDDMMGHGAEVTININYLQVPVNAQYKIDLGGRALLLQAGPYIGYAFGGKTTTQITLNDLPSYEKKNNDLVFGKQEDQLSPLDFGLDLGVGLQLDAIQIGVGYKLGVANLSNVDKASMKNRGFSISVTYFFGK